MTRSALAALLLIAMPAFAEETPATPVPAPELQLLSEHPVEGMRGGNLSGLTLCGEDLWAVSDRDDDLLYRMDRSAVVWQSEARHIQVPDVPDSGLPLGLKSRSLAASLVRGGELDFEGITCDAKGNLYVVSEAHAAVLQVPPEDPPQWLRLPAALVRQARASGMLLHFNALFEGLAINAAGDRLWLAAERERRGILAVQKPQTLWDCNAKCVLLSEAGYETVPPAMVSNRRVSRDFSDIAFYKGKLFTLERNAFKVCRRDADTAQVERCWSFAEGALTPERRYNEPFGLAEALVIDDQGAWIGLDNNNWARADGEKRPIVWRFAAPDGGWSAQP